MFCCTKLLILRSMEACVSHQQNRTQTSRCTLAFQHFFSWIAKCYSSHHRFQQTISLQSWLFKALARNPLQKPCFSNESFLLLNIKDHPRTFSSLYKAFIYVRSLRAPGVQKRLPITYTNKSSDCRPVPVEKAALPDDRLHVADWNLFCKAMKACARNGLQCIIYSTFWYTTRNSATSRCS